MNGCARFQRQLDDYVAGRCDPGEERWLARHAAACLRCYAEEADARAVRQALRGVMERAQATSTGSDEFLASLHARLQNEAASAAGRRPSAAPPPRLQFRRPAALAALGAMPALVALLLILAGLMREERRALLPAPSPGMASPPSELRAGGEPHQMVRGLPAAVPGSAGGPARVSKAGRIAPTRRSGIKRGHSPATVLQRRPGVEKQDNVSPLKPRVEVLPSALPRTRDTEDLQARLRREAPVRDDFVTIPFPRLVAADARQVAEAVDGYRREAAIVDSRLARPVTVAARAIALSDLCEQLRAETGIHLLAGPSVADEKVTLFCTQQPLRDVMRQLSRPFGYAWLRSRKGLGVGGSELEKAAAGRSPAPSSQPPTPVYRYELAQDLRSQLLEEELRNRDRNEALLALDREMNRFRKYLDLSPDEALVRARTARPEERKLLEKYAGSAWGLIQMYFRLSPAEMAALRSGKQLKYSQQPKEDRQPLPADLAHGIHQSRRDHRLIVQDGKYRLVSAKEHPDGLPLTAVPGARAMVMLRMPQSELGKFTLTGGPGTFISDDSPIPGTFELFGGADLVSGESPSALDPENAVANASLARDPALLRRVSVRPEPAPRMPPSPSRGAAGGGVRSEPRVTSADVLEALHRATGLPIVADFYTRLYPASAVSAQNQPLFDALNQLADAMRLRWRKQDGWLQIRSTSYFNDRLKEIPNRLLARWAASRKEHGALTLDDLIEIAQLSDAQLDAASMTEGAQELWGLQEWRVAHHWATRPQLRILAHFTPAQRQQAQTVAGLPFQRMTLVQQRFFLEQSGHAARLTEMDRAVLRVSYTLPGRYEWRQTGWRSYIPSPVQEATEEAALQSARRLHPDVPEEEIVPTKLDLAVMYAPGGYTPGSSSMQQVRIDRIGAAGWVP